MPKEIIHWKVADRAAALLRDTDLAGPLRDHARALSLGAVFPDVLFYLPPPAAPALVRLPRTLHGGSGEDTFPLLRLQAEHARNHPGDPALRAFLVGLASHVFTDAGMHPFVYHHSGSYETELTAKIRHRLLETAMDLAALRNPAELKRWSLAELLDGPDADPERLADLEGLAALGGVTSGTLRTALRRSLARFSRLQTLFRRPLPASIAHGLRPILPARLRTLSALFYAPRLARMAPLLQGPLEYLHPVSGQFVRTSLERLMDEAAEKTARLCTDLVPVLDGTAAPSDPGFGRGPWSVLWTERGPGLGSGLPGVGARQGRFFARDFLLPV